MYRSWEKALERNPLRLRQPKDECLAYLLDVDNLIPLPGRYLVYTRRNRQRDFFCFTRKDDLPLRAAST